MDTLFLVWLWMIGTRVCDIFSLGICVRHFYPCEGIRQGKMFDMTFTVAVMGKSIT